MTETITQTQSSQQLLKQMIGGWITQAVYVAAELGIADLLTDGPRTAEELAEQTSTHCSALYRVLRALASAGIFSEDADCRFSLTPLAESLRSNVPDSLRPFGIMMGAEFYQSWGNLLYSVRTGEQGFQKRFGVPFFQYMTEHPERHSIYDAAMMVHGMAETEPMLDAYDFSAFRTVVDIGGGNGRMLAAILNRYPTIEGILFDLPAVVDRSRTIISGLGLSKRCQIVGGDFFTSVPVADAYVMRHVIHDWNDDEAVSILRNCRDAMNPEGRILVVETVIPPLNKPCFGKWLDLMMLIVGGRERTEEQYRQLFSHAGLKLNRIVSTAHEISVIEGV
ncbi:MAG: methyltransferase [Planctomycetota bacterium]|jgi:SAM-dependent methyltransferase